MSSLNEVTLIGNVGRDPEIRHLPDGKAIAHLSIATSDTWKDASGEKRERTEWHRVVCFVPGLTKVIEQYIRKGSKVWLRGSLQTRKWEKDGEARYSTEVVLQPYRGQLIMLDSRGRESAGGGYVPGADEIDGDIPFAPEWRV